MRRCEGVEGRLILTQRSRVAERQRGACGATTPLRGYMNRGQRTEDRRQRMMRQWVVAGVGEAILSPILCLLSFVLCPNIMIIRVPRRRAFVSRASDADRRSRRRGDDGRRSPKRDNLREAKGSALRPSCHGVAATSQAASAARQMRRVSWSRVAQTPQGTEPRVR